MYNEHFGFGELPFSVTADPQYFYSNAVYQEVLTVLSNGIAEKDAFIVVTGEAGTGKTTLLRVTHRRSFDPCESESFTAV